MAAYDAAMTGKPSRRWSASQQQPPPAPQPIYLSDLNPTRIIQS
jgi:hypothetical protein